MVDTAGLPTAEDRGWVSSVTIDRRDPEALAHFWAGFLGRDPEGYEFCLTCCPRPT
jgi:hypothetical protein